MTEFGIFSSEGCVDRQFYSETEAQDALARYSDEDRDDLSIAALCPDHADDEQPAEGCDLCVEDEDEDEDEDEVTR